VIINIARRAHDHNWELDPITRSLLDTDFYKLLMLQFIWRHFPATQASFTLLNRATRSLAGAASLTRLFWSGWNGISGCPITIYPFGTGNCR